MGYYREDNQTEIPQDFWRDDLDDRPVMVSIKCITYNHEKYIREALEGFVNQQTNFRFEAIVHDDASTDGTAAIIQEYAEKYPSIIKPIYEKKNQYSKPESGLLTRIIHPHLRGKYIAFCEGDDYWIDPLKLQKQVDFLERNPEYGMCYTKSSLYSQVKDKIKGYSKGSSTTFDDLLISNSAPTLTVLIKTNVIENYLKDIEPSNKGWKMGDYPIWLYTSLKSKIHFIDESTGIYRILNESASHSKTYSSFLSFIKSSTDIKYFFLMYADRILDKELINTLEKERIWIDLRIAVNKENKKGIKKHLKSAKEKKIGRTKILFGYLSQFTVIRKIINKAMRVRHKIVN